MARYEPGLILGYTACPPIARMATQQEFLHSASGGLVALFYTVNRDKLLETTADRNHHGITSTAAYRCCLGAHCTTIGA
jgi:hypothetical protein